MFGPFRRAWDALQQVRAGMLSKGAEHAVQAQLLRHLFGNPFQAPLAPPASPVIHALAEAVYAGQDSAFALHDALLDAGHADLAEHFGEPNHPRGCWALDLILGKT
jgi:hypothetical protein